MTTQDKLERLRELSIDFYISELESNSIAPRDMAPIVSLLSSNSVTLEKRNSSLEEDIKTRVEDAKERRANASTNK